MKVSRSSYYEWVTHPGTNREKQNEELSKMIKVLFTEGRGTYGARRIARKLAQQGVVASRRRIGRLMADACLACKPTRQFKSTTESKHSLAISPNLLARQFAVTQPNRYWVGDITYIPT
jgi:putative transposase